MKKMTVKVNVSLQAKRTKVILAGLLLFNLTACNEDKPETTNVNFNLPSIDGVQPPPVVVFRDEEQNPLEPVEPVAPEDPAIDEIENEIEQEPANEFEYLKSANLVAKSKRLFAPKLLDNMFVGDDFYPLGWSPDGEKFAYAIERGEEGANSVFLGVFIQDLVTDKVIWKLKKVPQPNENSIADFWKNNQQTIVTQLKKYNIGLGGSGLDINTNSLTYKGDEFSYTVKSQQIEDGQIVSYRVLLNSKRKGSKEISKAGLKIIDLQSGDYGSTEKVAVIGYFQGSNKARIATVLGLMETGWEGTRVMRYKIIGASLKYGKWRK